MIEKKIYRDKLIDFINKEIKGFSKKYEKVFEFDEDVNQFLKSKLLKEINKIEFKKDEKGIYYSRKELKAISFSFFIDRKFDLSRIPFI